MRNDKDTGEELQWQYNLELQLAQRLRSAPKEQRRRLYGEIYDELYRTANGHPQLVRKSDVEASARKVRRDLAILSHFVHSGTTFLEIGAGDCGTALAVAAIVKHVYALEVSEKLTGNLVRPANFTLFNSDATDLRLNAGTVDFAYSNQVVEHLHPDDCVDHLMSVQRVLIAGGKYLCITPNRLNGPWDISRHFDTEARGLHLREYTNSELGARFIACGFSRVQVYIRAKGLHLLLPVFPLGLFERALSWLPAEVRRRVANWYPLQRILGVILVGTK